MPQKMKPTEPSSHATLVSPNVCRLRLVLWQVAQNSARARSLVNVSEGSGARMLRAARGHATGCKRLEASSEPLILYVTGGMKVGFE